MIKVLIVDDSAIVRDVLTDALNGESDIEVLGTAPNPFIARDKIVRLKPDVLTLDIEMPKMDGLTFLKKLMEYYPIPTIIVSSVTTQDNSAAITALEIGAFDVVNKPGTAISIEDVKQEVVTKVRQAYKVKDTYCSRRKIANIAIKQPSTVKSQLINVKTTDQYIAIGSSTGGTIAVEYLLKSLPANLPPIFIVQHMPENYTLAFANRLNNLSDLNVKEAENGEMVQRGSVYIARGGSHLKVKRRGAQLYIVLEKSERVQYQMPAVDVLFESLSEVVGQNVLAILLTGMGKDGADGMLKLKNVGAHTIAQDEASSIVWGMPKAAIDINAHKEIISLNNIPKSIVQHVSV
ncbi:MAG: chemotaxis response regulator protein-glutamate methylesterase [Spirochaetaceae bacterium]